MARHRRRGPLWDPEAWVYLGLLVLTVIIAALAVALDVI